MTEHVCALSARKPQPKKRLLSLALLSGLFLFVGCGDDGPGPPPLPTVTELPAPDPPPRANIDLEVLDFGAFTNGDGNWFQIEFRIAERAGVGANINFARLEVFRATGEFEERREVGSGQIVRGADDNRLEAHTEETALVWFQFGSTIKKGRRLRYTMGFTDDNGYDHERVQEFVFR